QVDYIHDGLGRTVEVRGVDPDGTGPAARPVWQTEFDLAGNVLVERDPLGHERTHAYDDLHRRTLTVLEDPDGAGPLASPTIGYTWDGVGNLLSLRDAANNITSWTYDDQNRPTHETNELGLTRVTTFDNVGLATSHTDRNGRKVEWDRDNLYRVTQERWKDSLGTVVHTISSTWDAASQLTSISDAFATYAYARDDLGRVTSIDNAGTPGVPNVVLAQTWDVASRRTGLAATIGGVADFVNTYSFDALGRMTRIEQTDGDPAAGYVVRDKRVDLKYLADGRFDTITRYEDLAGTALVAQTAFGFDDAGRLIALDHTKGSTTLAAYDWQLDAAGRITAQTSTADGTSTFGYDNNWQILSADHASQADEGFSWDANGNPTMTGWTVDTNNRLTSDGTYDYLHDNEGNRTRTTNIATGEYVEYSWDHRNRLTDVVFKTAAGVTTMHVRYGYDAFNRLVRRELDADGDGVFESAEAFVYDGADMVLVLDETGSLTHRFLPDAATDAVFASEDALGEILWNLTDHQGTVRDVADYDAATDTTSVVNHLTYSAFGAITSQSDPTKTPLSAYTGMYRDPDTGLQKHGARWFDPATQQWLSEDPIGFAAGDSNLRRYVGNSPANFIDPSGLVPSQAWTTSLDNIITYVEAFERRDPDASPAEILVRVRDGIAGGFFPRQPHSGAAGTGRLGDVLDWAPDAGIFAWLRAGLNILGESGLLPAHWHSPALPPPARRGPGDWAYLYTEEKGWIDLGHFFEAARYARWLPDTWVAWGGLAVELYQSFLGITQPRLPGAGSSAFSPEDLPSNALGIDFGSSLRMDQPLSTQLRAFMTPLNPTPPEQGWGFPFLPLTERHWEIMWQRDPQAAKYLAKLIGTSAEERRQLEAALMTAAEAVLEAWKALSDTFGGK
ncbi:MAG TPA: RHS repeat-associated core domain-containing protein, partial [Planctomycetaceae bacterium]|nr:RHS repeat-associated core domain-containing protein [Planctomycetaceae bacterium]